MEEIQITVIGAGIVGLACAYELSGDYGNLFVMERHSSFGEETSSRNSEVIHAGMYYPPGSLKAELCVEGNRLIYEHCEKYNIGFRKTGKIIAAADTAESRALVDLIRNGEKNNVPGLRLLSSEEVKELEPNIHAESGLLSSSTGIFDTHGLMKSLVSLCKDRGGEIVYDTEVIALEKVRHGFIVKVRDKQEGLFEFFSRVVINSAGLNSGQVSGMAGISPPEYKLNYCKGDYFRVVSGKAKLVNRLIYPVPGGEGISLGIHAALDLGGGLRLGPDAEYVDEIDYRVHEEKRDYFYRKAKKIMPFIEPDDLTPDTSGIRPKLQGPGQGFRDFVIQEESGRGVPGLINLIGIDSPGLTGSLAIARKVKRLVKSLG